ncbi:MAG TPA: hypothetical protein VG106_16185, partial [Vicinamibacterales bacterium]|nr:hypothetical protein [Vicinamibacterales bacterium]
PSEFAEFSEEHEKLQAGILGLDCLDAWARRDRRAASVETERVESDELSELFAALTIPAPVASVGYPGGCRIRRVRVPPDPSAKPAGKKGQPVILSRRALDEMRSANR